MKPHALAAEALGTFLLTLVVTLSITQGSPVPTAVLAGVTLAMIAYVLGPVSGGHVNPAVTLSLLSVKKIAPMPAVGYIVAQILGALIAMFAAQMLTGDVPSLPVVDDPIVALCEGIGAFVFLLGVTAAVHGKVPTDAAGAVVGASLTLGAIVASANANGILNPAVALGLGSLSVSYVVGPIVGGVLAAWLYRDLASRN